MNFRFDQEIDLHASPQWKESMEQDNATDPLIDKGKKQASLNHFYQNQNRAIFVRDLPFHTTSEMLRDFVEKTLEKPGCVEDSLVRYSHQGKTLQVACVLLKSEAHIAEALEKLHGCRFHGRDLRVTIYNNKAPIEDSQNAAVQFSFLASEAQIPLVTEEIVRAHMEEMYGPLRDVCIRFHRYAETGIQSGYGFLTFVHESDNERAVDEVQKKLIHNLQYDCRWSSKCKPVSAPGTLRNKRLVHLAAATPTYGPEALAVLHQQSDQQSNSDKKDLGLFDSAAPARGHDALHSHPYHSAARRAVSSSSSPSTSTTTYDVGYSNQMYAHKQSTSGYGNPPTALPNTAYHKHIDPRYIPSPRDYPLRDEQQHYARSYRGMGREDMDSFLMDPHYAGYHRGRPPYDSPHGALPHHDPYLYDRDRRYYNRGSGGQHPYDRRMPPYDPYLERDPYLADSRYRAGGGPYDPHLPAPARISPPHGYPDASHYPAASASGRSQYDLSYGGADPNRYPVGTGRRGASYPSDLGTEDDYAHRHMLHGSSLSLGGAARTSPSSYSSGSSRSLFEGPGSHPYHQQTHLNDPFDPRDIPVSQRHLSAHPLPLPPSRQYTDELSLSTTGSFNTLQLPLGGNVMSADAIPPSILFGSTVSSGRKSADDDVQLACSTKSASPSSSLTFPVSTSLLNTLNNTTVDIAGPAASFFSSEHVSLTASNSLPTATTDIWSTAFNVDVNNLLAASEDRSATETTTEHKDALNTDIL